VCQNIYKTCVDIFIHQNLIKNKKNHEDVVIMEPGTWFDEDRLALTVLPGNMNTGGSTVPLALPQATIDKW
jgi:hypothetical protein